MNCLDLPASCQPGQTVECLNSASTQCCTDSVTENCANMDQTCGWQCANTTNTHHHQQPSKVNTEEKFCNGYGTDMFMQGFTVRKIIPRKLFMERKTNPSQVVTVGTPA